MREAITVLGAVVCTACSGARRLVGYQGRDGRSWLGHGRGRRPEAGTARWNRVHLRVTGALSQGAAAVPALRSASEPAAYCPRTKWTSWSPSSPETVPSAVVPVTTRSKDKPDEVNSVNAVNGRPRQPPGEQSQA